MQNQSPLSKWHEELLKRSRSSSTWHPAAAGSTFACWIDPLGPSGVKTVSSLRPPIAMLSNAVAASSGYGTSSLSSSRVHTTHPVYFPSMEPSRRLIEMVSRVCSIHYSLYFYLRALESRKFNADSKVCCCCCCCCYSLFSFLFFLFLFFLFHEPNHHLSKSTATITSQPPPPPSSSTPDTSTTRVRIILSSVSSVSTGASLIHHRCAATEEHGGVRSFSLLWTMLFLVTTDL